MFPYLFFQIKVFYIFYLFSPKFLTKTYINKQAKGDWQIRRGEKIDQHRQM